MAGVYDRPAADFDKLKPDSTTLWCYEFPCPRPPPCRGNAPQQSGTQKFTDLPCGHRGGIGRPRLLAWTWNNLRTHEEIESR